MTRKFGWSKNLLIHQDEYTFDFLELSEEYAERELERALVARIEASLRTIVEYALRDAHRPIGVATYRIVRRLPRELQGQLPSPQQIGKLLEGLG
jgi:hypothetical protein